MSPELPRTCDAVVVGAGIIGAACAHYLVAAGLDVLVVDRGGVAAGTTGAGEGNILVSDKGPGPELKLALLSAKLWRDLGEVLGPRAELQAKGGLVVAVHAPTLVALRAFAQDQRESGVQAEAVDGDGLARRVPTSRPAWPAGCSTPRTSRCSP